MPDSSIFQRLSTLSIVTLALCSWEQLSWEQLPAGEIRPVDSLPMSDPQIPALVAQKFDSSHPGNSKFARLPKKV